MITLPALISFSSQKSSSRGLPRRSAMRRSRALRCGRTLLVLIHRFKIRAIDLTERVVDEAAAIRRRPFDQRQILRQKQHHIDQPDDVHDALFDAIDADHLAEARVAFRRAFDHQRDFEAGQRVLARTDLAGDARERQRIVLDAPVDQLAVAGGVGRFRRRQIIDRFQQAGFALRVGAMQHNRRVGGQAEFQPGVVAKIGQGEVFNVHERLVIRTLILPDFSLKFHWQQANCPARDNQFTQTY